MTETDQDLPEAPSHLRKVADILIDDSSSSLHIDVLDEADNARIIIIDGESLVYFVIKHAHFQSLHGLNVILGVYIAERFLEQFIRRGACIHVIFTDDRAALFDLNQLAFRSVLRRHLQGNCR